MRVRRSGFTLVELLVVISIIGMLMALLFPAVQAARETGRGNTCRNNMRNLALAQYQYENRRGHYAGFWEYAHPSSASAANPVWYARQMMYQLWPDLERNDLYELYSRDNLPQHWFPSNAPYMDLTVCPSNPQRTGTPSAYVYNFNGWTPDEQGFQYVTGWSGLMYGNYSLEYLPAYYQGNNNSAYIGAHDGAATTIIIAENLDVPTSGWYNASEAVMGFHWGDYSPTNQQQYQKVNAANKGTGYNGWCTERPSFNHPQSVNVGFADIHVRVLRETVSYQVYAHLCTPWGRRQEPNPASPTPNNYNYVNIWQNALSESNF